MLVGPGIELWQATYEVEWYTIHFQGSVLTCHTDVQVTILSWDLGKLVDFDQLRGRSWWTSNICLKTIGSIGQQGFDSPSLSIFHCFSTSCHLPLRKTILEIPPEASPKCMEGPFRALQTLAPFNSLQGTHRRHRSHHHRRSHTWILSQTPTEVSLDCKHVQVCWTSLNTVVYNYWNFSHL